MSASGTSRFSVVGIYIVVCEEESVDACDSISQRADVNMPDDSTAFWVNGLIDLLTASNLFDIIGGGWLTHPASSLFSLIFCSYLFSGVKAEQS